MLPAEDMAEGFTERFSPRNVKNAVYTGTLRELFSSIFNE